MQHQENWKPMAEFDETIHISDHGRVRSFRVDSFEGKLLKPKIHKGVYHQYIIKNQGVYRSFLVHRKVGEYFLPNPDNLPCIDHIQNKDKVNNNHVSNLQWISHEDNVRKDQAYTIECTHPVLGTRLAQGTRQAAAIASCSRSNVQYCLRNNTTTRTDWSFKIIK
jgi:hypothetical protein